MTPTVEAVKEERPSINALSCKRNILKSALKATGELDIFASNVKTVKANDYNDVDSSAFVFPSETWILPIITLGVMVVYAALAIFFYNSDG